MRKIAFIITLTLLLSVGLFGQFESILDVETALSTDAVMKGSEFSAAVLVHIKDPWHINSWQPLDEFSIPTTVTFEASDNYDITDIIYPEHDLVELSISDEPFALYDGDIIIYVNGKIADDASAPVVLKGQMKYQGCNNTSCLPPESASIEQEINIVDDPAKIKSINDGIFADLKTEPEQPAAEIDNNKNADSFNVAESFSQKGIILTYLLILLGGLGLVLTPCVYPLIPITMSYFGGQASNSKGKTIVLALIYVLGMAIINSTIGTIAAMSGGLLGSFMTNPFVLIFIAAVLVALALSMFGLYEFGLPSFLTNLGGGAKTGYFGALLMGMTMGIVAAPCIGPFVIGLLTYVAATGNPFIGFSMFFTLSVGLGIPFIFLAFFSGKISNLPQAGDWMVGVRTIFGLILLGMALYFLNPIIPDNIFTILLPLFLAISGIYLLIFNKAGDSSRVFSYFKKSLAILAIFAAGYLAKTDNTVTTERMAWQHYSDDYYTTAINNDRPVIIDFYADWCIPCKELDKFTFTDKDIITLSGEFDLIKVDLTGGAKGKIKELKDQYDVKGVPTIVFINDQGEEMVKQRTLGFVKPDVFIKKMHTTLNN
ncbi:MAG: cytochrome c biogenesis protein CcdA [Fidelibacterota bacterium]